MSRVSQEELYNDKDVITQILKLKGTVNDYAGGIIENIDVSGNDLVIDWADGTSVSLPLPPPTGISSIAGSISGTNLIITIYMTDGSSHAFTTPLNGIATENYVDTKDAQNVKLTGVQTVGGVKTFSDSPVVPDTPATEHSAVNQDWAENVVYDNDTINNLLHKEGDEIFTGTKWSLGYIYLKRNDLDRATSPATATTVNTPAFVTDANKQALGGLEYMFLTNGHRLFRLRLATKTGTFQYKTLFEIDENGTVIV